MILAAAVDVLMHDNDAPFRVRMRFDGFLDQRLMVGRIVVVRIDHDEERVAIRVEIAVASRRRVRFLRERIRHVEMVLVARCHAVMVADARRFRQAAKRFRRQIACVLHLKCVISQRQKNTGLPV